MAACGVPEIQVANVASDAWRWRNVKRKTDRTDAMKLLDLSASDRLPTVHVPEASVRGWRALIAYRARLAEQLVALIDDPSRFRSGKQVASYLGLVPRQFQSGQMDRHGRITGHGNRLARSLLVEVSWLGLRNRT